MTSVCSISITVIRRQHFRLPVYARLVLTIISINAIFTCVLITFLLPNEPPRHRDRLQTGSKALPVANVRLKSTTHKPTSGSEYYVTLCANRLYGPHRTGNQLFLLAAALYAAIRTNRKLTMPGACRWSLDTTFKMAARKDNDDNNNSSNSIVIERYSDSDPPPCPCRQLWPPEGTSTFIHGDLMLDSPTGLQKLTPSVTRSQEAGQSHNATDISIGHARTLELCGLYQTYRYADSLSPQLRSLLTFKPEVRREVNSFFGESRPVDWTHGSFIRVGFHIRRGDFVRHDWRDVGLTVVDEGFVNRVVDYFISRYRRVQFVIATDDKHWATSVFRSKMSNSSVAIVKSPTGDILEPRTFGKDVDKNNSLDRTSVVVKPEVSAVLSEGRSAAVDLALVSSCDAVVISTGSFGWWAAWLANRPITIYYSLWPRPNSPLSKYFRAKEYFPQRWIPMQ